MAGEPRGERKPGCDQAIKPWLVVGSSLFADAQELAVGVRSAKLKAADSLVEGKGSQRG
jgi:hypothetical protein